MNNMEERIWDYIDGTCTTEEQQAISSLISTDEVWKAKYNELLAFKSDLDAVSLDEPSMAFTYNVMEAIRTEAAAKPLRSAVNQRIIWALGAFFILTITAMLIYVIAGVNWHQVNDTRDILPQVKVPSVDLSFNSNLVRGALLFDLVLGLYILDAYLRKKLNGKQAQ